MNIGPMKVRLVHWWHLNKGVVLWVMMGATLTMNAIWWAWGRYFNG